MRIYSRVSTKPLLNDAKRLLPVEVRRSKTLLLKLPNMVRRGGGGVGVVGTNKIACKFSQLCGAISSYIL